jgi:glycosyltransferase involved in cell wall biosynthesis
LAFNSSYNWNTFFEKSCRLVSKSADIDLREQLEQIRDKSAILYPGVDFTHFRKEPRKKNSVPVICWNHRWEHDKNPDGFFQSLDELERKGYDFRLVLLGQCFRDIPSVFKHAGERFEGKIEHFGFAAGREEYIRLLEKCDIVVSTAIHEFFGISVIEAIRAGCFPLVPDRLSYPELYPQKYRYGVGELTGRLCALLERFKRDEANICEIDTERFSWQSLKSTYEKWLFPWEKD